MPDTLTAGQLIHQLQTLDRDQPVFLAINPYWPFAHRIDKVITVPDGPRTTAYIAENGQEDYLPQAVCTELNWP